MANENGDRRRELDPIGLAVDIVSAFVSHNSLPASELAPLVRSVHHMLAQLGGEETVESQPALVPAVPIKKSITPNHLVCLEDGKTFKSLKRHLRARYNLTPDAYRARWGLPSDYPMVAPNYAAARSRLAKDMGLGLQRRKAAVEDAESAGLGFTAPRQRSRTASG